MLTGVVCGAAAGNLVPYPSTLPFLKPSPTFLSSFFHLILTAEMECPYDFD